MLTATLVGSGLARPGLAQTSMDNALALVIVERGLERFFEAVRSGYGNYWLLRRGDVEASPPNMQVLYWSDNDADNFMTAVGVLARERGLRALEMERAGAWPQLEAGTAAELVLMTQSFLKSYRDAAPAKFRASWQWVLAGIAMTAGALGLAYANTRD